VELLTAEGTSGPGTGEAHLDRVLEKLALFSAPKTPRPLSAPWNEGREVRVRLGNRGAAGATQDEG